MINQWYVTGDTHAEFFRLKPFHDAIPDNECWGLIILGDVGFNYYLSKKDDKLKYQVCHNYPKLKLFCIRGNHEARPEDVERMKEIWCEDVGNFVYYQKEFPNIFYLKDGHSYEFNGMEAFVIGGAYSVDKAFRLERKKIGLYSGWFENEQLSKEEMSRIEETISGRSFDFILSHTCPWSWEPRDLFLDFISQRSVDDSMELWMDQLKEKINYRVWLCGHFHADRILAKRAQMLHLSIKRLDDILHYWED